MKRAVFYIKDKQLYHFGDGRNIIDYFPSDKLFSAILNVASIMYDGEEFQSVIKKLKDIEISSMFLGIEILNSCTQEAKKIFFTQKPLYKTGNKKTSDRDLTLLKKIKKVTYVSDEILQKLLDSFDKMENKFVHDFDNDILIQDKFALSDNEIKDVKVDKWKLQNIKFVKNISRTRMIENRYMGTSQDVFYNDFIEVNHVKLGDFIIKPFMYFNIKNYFEELSGILALLCDEGIGGHRSNGAGNFEKVEIINSEINYSEEGEFYMNISSIFPEKNDIKSENVKSYALGDRNGFIYSCGSTGIKKPYYRVIKEGSIFTNHKVKGKILEMEIPNLEHKVYLYGKAFLIGFGGKVI